ncbi:hypothetical protein DFP83_102133 [Idiomarina fontislapidosi]|uniref:Uncharacterized protein n=1 Tax=Idiomarina fontislapidosi TaxID=263723 RepID=A0A432Y9R5_9GAMM|nr:hypothetical protein [Idiomarina fontislapidosi]PYE34390.1 hypothetical protein DFP83_102133 [Idiomarina fontislapidosi]RUO57651.1 hypothetical protein CWE25_04065 [Idiomarina fontislapidosi]|tara:strand:+ start:2647 stop:2973 length:327 start_codon:yes stop_codon:yes gene_type:complete
MQVIPQLNYRFDSAQRLATHISQLDSQLVLWCTLRQQVTEQVHVCITLPDGLSPFNGQLSVGATLVGQNKQHFIGLLINEQQALFRLRCLALIQPHRQLCGTILRTLF